MIQPSKYNGINFTPSFTRSHDLINYDGQRRKKYVNRYVDLKWLSFFYDSSVEPIIIKLTVISANNSFDIDYDHSAILEGGTIYYFNIPDDYLDTGDSYCRLQINNDIIYSEIFEGILQSKLTEKGVKHLIATNNDDRFGYISNQIFGFFKTIEFDSEIFLTNKTEFEYSYSRKKILKAENQIAKRLKFIDLTAYDQNLLKWLCNCQNLTIDGKAYQLISDFTEQLIDLNSEIKDLQADFVEVEQSFFGDGATEPPKNIFKQNFFM